MVCMLPFYCVVNQDSPLAGKSGIVYSDLIGSLLGQRRSARYVCFLHPLPRVLYTPVRIANTMYTNEIMREPQ